MSRSEYTYDSDFTWRQIMYRGAVKSAFRGKRGQAFLREMKVALESMEKKELIIGELVRNGSYCALGAVGHYRRQDDEMESMTADKYGDEYRDISSFFGIAPAMVREIIGNNEDWRLDESPLERWHRMHEWVCKNIKAKGTE